MEDLSAPFLNLAELARATQNVAAVAEVANETANEIVNKVSTSVAGVAGKAAEGMSTNIGSLNSAELSGFIKKYWLFLIIGLVGLFVIYKLMNSEKAERLEAEKEEEERMRMMEEQSRMPKETDLESAQRYYHQFKNNIGNKKMNYHLAIKHFEAAFEEMPDLRIALTLAKLHHEGVPDQENNPGIPPNAQAAIQYYTIAVRNGNTKSLIDLASIYHWGLPRFKTNRTYAKALYALLMKVGTKYWQGVAKDRLLQIMEEEGKVLGTDGGIDGAVLQNFASDLLGNSPFNENFASLNTLGISPAELTKDNVTQGIDEDYIKDLQNDFNQINPANRNRNIERNDIIKNNPQSARDHMVVNTTRISLEKLKSKTHIQFPIKDVLKQIHTFVENNITDHTKAKKIVLLLNHMAKNQHSCDFDETKELDALMIVWNRIFNSTNRSKQKIMIDNLMNELAECVEYGEIVCPSGIITRILDSLNFVDPEVKIMPEWMIRDEMLQKAAKVREIMLKKAPGKVRDALESPKPTHQEIIIVKNFQERFKRELWDRFKKDYVETAIMSEDLLKTQLNEWVDNMF